MADLIGAQLVKLVSRTSAQIDARAHELGRSERIARRRNGPVVSVAAFLERAYRRSKSDEHAMSGSGVYVDAAEVTGRISKRSGSN